MGLGDTAFGRYSYGCFLAHISGVGGWLGDAAIGERVTFTFFSSYFATSDVEDWLGDTAIEREGYVYFF